MLFRWYFYCHTLALALFLHPLESPFYTLPPCVRFSLAAFHTQRVGVCVCAWTQTTFDCEMFWCNWLMLRHFSVHFSPFFCIFGRNHIHTHAHTHTLFNARIFFSKLFSVHSQAMRFISSPFMRTFSKVAFK